MRFYNILCTRWNDFCRRARSIIRKNRFPVAGVAWQSVRLWRGLPLLLVPDVHVKLYFPVAPKVRPRGPEEVRNTLYFSSQIHIVFFVDLHGGDHAKGDGVDENRLSFFRLNLRHVYYPTRRQASSNPPERPTAIRLLLSSPGEIHVMRIGRHRRGFRSPEN